jgi:hypothetical protein
LLATHAFCTGIARCFCTRSALVGWL